MFSLGRLATGLASPADDVESASRGTASDATSTAAPVDNRNTTTTPSSRPRSTAPSKAPAGSSTGPCLTGATPTTLGNVPRSLPPTASAAGLKGLPLQLITTALSVGPTLLPPHLANLITALALSMRVSLRATAFFVEAILESCKYGTAASLGLTRRALIAAVSSARTVYAVREGLDWAGDKLGALKGDDPFLSVLDKVRPQGSLRAAQSCCAVRRSHPADRLAPSLTTRTAPRAVHEPRHLPDHPHLHPGRALCGAT